jgi:DNA/RNA endonuclease YhcR with UshA esterase domain
MKIRFAFFALLIFFLVGLEVSAQKTPNPTSISIVDAKDHVGERVTICGKVEDTYYNAKVNGKPFMIYFGAKYPKQTFSAVIWNDDLKNFDYKPDEYLKGKFICIIGVIKMYKGKPEMVLNTQEQIYE